MKQLIQRIRKAFAIHNVRQRSLDWWDTLGYQEQLELESRYFDESETGETTDIDIEAMYRTYVA
jgi:hypothetical protein